MAEAKRQPRPTIFDVFCSVVRKEGRLFNDEESAAHNVVRHRYEGPGELSLKKKEGHSEDVNSSNKPGDMVDGREIKSVYVLIKRKPTKKFPNVRFVPSIGHVRAGAAASRQLIRGLTVAACFIGRQTLSSDEEAALLDKLNTGLSAKRRGELPTELQMIIDDHIKPSRGLTEYTQGIECTTPIGPVFVPVVEYDQAFYVSGVSKGLVNYKLRYGYLVERLNRPALMTSETN